MGFNSGFKGLKIKDYVLAFRTYSFNSWTDSSTSIHISWLYCIYKSEFRNYQLLRAV